MYKAAVMGDMDSIYGFSGLGLEIFPAETKEDAEKIFKKIAALDYAVIYITELCASLIEEEIEKVAENLLPAVILIPGVKGNTGNGLSAVKKSVEQAVGSDILFGDEN